MNKHPAPVSRYAIPDTTQETRSEWLNAARRMQSVAKSKGVSIITMQVVVNAEGEPIYWLAPQVRQIEPAARADEFLRLFLGQKIDP